MRNPRLLYLGSYTFFVALDRERGTTGLVLVVLSLTSTSMVDVVVV